MLKQPVSEGSFIRSTHSALHQVLTTSRACLWILTKFRHIFDSFWFAFNQSTSLRSKFDVWIFSFHSLGDLPWIGLSVTPDVNQHGPKCSWLHTRCSWCRLGVAWWLAAVACGVTFWFILVYFWFYPCFFGFFGFFGSGQAYCCLSTDHRALPNWPRTKKTKKTKKTGGKTKSKPK